MKTAFLFTVILFSLLATSALAEFYRWTDAEGVVHFTDSRRKIPSKYRSKAKKVPVMEEPAPTAPKRATDRTPPVQVIPSTPAAAAPAGAPSAQPLATAGGHDEQWWRERFNSIRNELNVVRQRLAQKQSKMVELRRRRAIYTRIEDREAVNAMQSAISADETREAELLRQLDVLDQEATRAGVPVEWRQ